jgi:hypothetical protein
MARRYACEGTKLNVVFAQAANDKYPAEEFLESLDRLDQARMYALFNQLANKGVIQNVQHFKKLQGSIWEFKRSQIRMFCGFGDDQTVVLTSGYFKKQNKIDPEEISRAIRILREDAERQEKDKNQENVKKKSGCLSSRRSSVPKPAFTVYRGTAGGENKE